MSNYLDDDFDPVDELWERELANNDERSINALDLPAESSSGDPRTDAKKAQLRFQLQQSTARGIIPPKEALRAYDGDDEGFMAKAIEATLGIPATTSGLQTFVDVLSLDNYASAAYAKARSDALNASKDEHGNIPWQDRVNPFAFSPSDFVKHYQDRTYFGDVYGVDYDLGTKEGWGAIATDIFLSPSTYLTFGVGAGAKVMFKGAIPTLKNMLGTASKGGKLLSKQMAEEGVELTLSRWGTKVQKEAAEEFFPIIEKEIAEEIAGGAKLAHIGAREDFLSRSVEYMLNPENYGRLAKKAWEKDKRLTSRLQRLIGKSIDDDIAPVMGRVFSETTPLHLKEIGVPGRRLRTALEGLDQNKWYGRFSYASMKPFNASWGLSDNQRSLFETMRNSTHNQQREWTRRIADDFGDLTDDEADAVTMLLEGIEEGADFTARNAEPVLGVNYSAKVLEKSRLAKQLFDDIAVEEQKYQILNETLPQYVSHIFNHDTRKVDQFMKVVEEKGWRTGGNPFSEHRQIASISDLKGLFPEDQVITNIGHILYRRKMMSVDLVNKQKFYMELKATSGWPATLIAKAGESVPAAYKTRMMETRGSVVEFADVRQFWEHEGINTAKWGFEKGNRDQNMRVLDWLTTERTARGTEATWMTDNLKNFSPTLKKDFSVRYKGESFKVDALAAINGLIRNDPLDKLPFDQIKTAIKRFDQELRKSNVGPLLGIMPELEQLILKSLRNPKKPPAEYKKLLADLNAPVKDLKLATAVPEEIIIRGRNARREVGILTDELNPSPQVVDSIMTMLGKRGFGFMPEEVGQLTKSMFDKKTVGDLTSAEADVLETFLGVHFGKKSAIEQYSAMTGQKMVKVEFSTARGKIPSLIKTNVDKVLSGYKKTTDDLSAKATSLNESLAPIRTAENELVRDRDLIAALNRKLHDKIDARKKLTRNSPKWLDSINESNAIKQNLSKLKSSVGTPKEIVRKIAALEKKREKIKADKKVVSKKINVNKAKEKWARAADAHARNPTKKTAKALKSAEERARKLGGEKVKHGVETLAADAKVWKPIDPRHYEDVVVPAKETVRKTAEGLYDISREPGTFGPMISEVGERAFALEAKSYYLPKSIADLIRDIEVGAGYKGHGPAMTWMLRRYDMVQNLYKAPLMAVWPEFYKRNTVTNVSLTYLKSGLAMLNPSHQQDFLRTLVYVLSKESIDIKNLPKSYPAFTSQFGAITGGVVGGMAHAKEEGHEWYDPRNLAGVLEGALTGGVAGAAVGVPLGLATKATIQSAARGGGGALVPHAAMGATAGALAAPEGQEVSGAAAGALAGGAFAKKALGKGFNNVDKIAEMTIKVGNKKFTIAEFAEEAAARGVFITHVSEEIFKQSGAKALAMSERMGITADKSIAQAMKPSQALFARDIFRAGELASEIPTRLMLFTIEAKRTGSLGEAARSVKKYLYDYSNLTVFERRFMRRMMPFYTWTKHALSVSADSLYKQPGRVGHMYKFVNNQNNHIDADPADYPDWLSVRLKRVKVTRDLITGEKKVDVKQGYGLVQEDTMQLWKDAFGGDASRLLTRGPFALVPALESMVDKDFFRGSHIKAQLYNSSSYESGRAYQNSPEWLKKAVGYRVDESGYAKVDPRAAWLLSEIPPSRFINMARKIYDSPDGKFNWFSLARQVLGEKIYKYGPEQKLYYDKAKLDRMAALLKHYGQLNVLQTYSAKEKPVDKPGLSKSTFKPVKPSY